MAAIAFAFGSLTGGIDVANAPGSNEKTTPRLTTGQRAVNIAPLFFGGLVAKYVARSGYGIVSQGAAFGATTEITGTAIEDIRQRQFSGAGTYFKRGAIALLIGGATFGIGNLLGRAVTSTIRYTKRITGSLKAGWRRGAENDAEFASLSSWKEKLYHEIGALTIEKEQHNALSAVVGGRSQVQAHIARGARLVEEHGIWRALFRTSWSALPGNLASGPTSGMRRYLVPAGVVTATAFGAAGAAAGAALYAGGSALLRLFRNSDNPRKAQ